MDNPDQRYADKVWHSAIARLTGGLSPTALATAYLDWSMHLIGSPTKQSELCALTQQSAVSLLLGREIAGVAEDQRFQGPAWSAPPFRYWRDMFLAQQNWWDAATRDLMGVEPKHRDVVQFGARQFLDMASPTNFALTNPQVIVRTQKEAGHNLLRGVQNWLEDFSRLVSHSSPKNTEYEVGQTVAVTQGEVVFRNKLIELIRYAPTTKKAKAEPILIVPAWIMKFYILDLSPHNSLVKYLCDHGYEVFMISWQNPTKEDADLSMQNYVDLGVRAACEAIKADCAAPIHAVGYCLGGTLLTITAAAMARDQDSSFASLTLLASQVDFSEPGELGLFINESQVAFLEDLMSTQGFLRADQMAGAFKMLRSNDLIWSRVVRHYLLGERTAMNDLMAWNADATRMPAKMHSEYLRRLFLNNDLAKGRYMVDGRAVALTDIRVPIFCLATETDHVSPWRSVYRLLLLTDTDVTFVLTNGGHNGGVLSYPAHPNRHVRVLHKIEGDTHIRAQRWFDEEDADPGSWWPLWTDWLATKSEVRKGPRPKTARASLGPAPGTYVFG